jgi:hypothetical protein
MRIRSKVQEGKTDFFQKNTLEPHVSRQNNYPAYRETVVLTVHHC